MKCARVYSYSSLYQSYQWQARGTSLVFVPDSPSSTVPWKESGPEVQHSWVQVPIFHLLSMQPWESPLGPSQLFSFPHLLKGDGKSIWHLGAL